MSSYGPDGDGVLKTPSARKSTAGSVGLIRTLDELTIRSPAGCGSQRLKSSSYSAAALGPPEMCLYISLLNPNGLNSGSAALIALV